MKIFFFLFTIGVALQVPAHAREEKPEIDLGELHVQGDIRRPMTTFYQLKSMHETTLQELSDLSFRDFERSLLHPQETKNDQKDKGHDR